MDILENVKNVLSFIANHLKAEYVALFSILVTIVIYIFNRRAELKFKKYESQQTEYAKLISFLSIAFTHPEKLELDENDKLNKEVQQEFYDMGHL